MKATQEVCFQYVYYFVKAEEEIIYCWDVLPFLETCDLSFDTLHILFAIHLYFIIITHEVQKYLQKIYFK